MVSYWSYYPSSYPFQQDPEDAPIISDSTLLFPSNASSLLPEGLQKTNPSFHLLIPAAERTPGLCRTVASSMILNYPPPTLMGYGKPQPRVGPAGKYNHEQAKIADIREYLEHAGDVHDGDFILIVDGPDTFFQLPAEVLVSRFQRLLRENNQKLHKKYGAATVYKQLSDPEVVPKYSQRVMFGASKSCLPGVVDAAEPACFVPPQSSLPPDVYGWRTDSDAKGMLNRPRWLNGDVAIGQAGDLKRIYAEMTRLLGHYYNITAEKEAWAKLFGLQEYVRELERLRESNPIMEWLYDFIGISDKTNITDVVIRLERGQRYEYGVGVDYESQLFFNTHLAHNDAAWFEYNNVTKASATQAQHGVPRESRLLLPKDLTIGSPFTRPHRVPDSTVNPGYNVTLDKLPDKRDLGWDGVRLVTNARSGSVPALINLNGIELRDVWWANMWYAPYARALLRNAIRSSRSQASLQPFVTGGQELWDSRGGFGGVWTDSGEWIAFGDLCWGFEQEVFNDGLGLWGHEEEGSSGQRVYSEWAKFIKDKGGTESLIKEDEDD